MESGMVENRGARRPLGSRPAERKEPAADLVPANPLPARTALLQVALLAGIPLVLLLLARFVLHQYFPGLGY
jgi:hypothetical protein